MSILDALRVQQAENSSVRDLAMLPQAQIMKLAQMGQIPAEVVPVIINEKARMAQQTAQMQASQAPMQPTVLEQAMAQNAQAEAPMTGVASIPTQMFDERNYAGGGIIAFDDGGEVRAGVRKMPSPTFDKDEQELVVEYLKKLDDGRLMAALSKREGMPTVAQLLAAKALGEGQVSLGATGTPRELQAIMAGYSRPFAGGQVGINAAIPARSPKTPQFGLSYSRQFNKGGDVALQGGGFADPTDVIYGEPTETYTPPASSPSTVSGIDAYIREAAARRAEARTPSAAMLALEQALGDTGRFQGARDEARNMALLQAGLGILGSASPYALQNIGRGAAGAAESYQRQLGDIRRQEREALGQRAALDVRKQEQALADIASGEAQYAAARKEALEEKKLASREEIERQRAESAERRQESRNEALARGLSGGRQTDRATRINDYVTYMREQGSQESDAVLRYKAQEAIDRQDERLSLQGQALQTRIASEAYATAIREINERRGARGRGSTEDERNKIVKWQQDGGSIQSYWENETRNRAAELMKEMGQFVTGPLVGQPRTAPATQPAAAPRPQRQPPDLTKISGVPPGSAIGKFVEGKGWEVLQGGKVRGHIQED